MSVGKGNNVRHGKSVSFRKGTPVFIVDRREKEVWQIIDELDAEFDKYSSPDVRPQEIDLNTSDSNSYLSHSAGKPENNFIKKSAKYSEIVLYGYGHESRIKTVEKSALKSWDGSKSAMVNGGLWLSQSSIKRCLPKKIKDVWWFLPPVVWPANENLFCETIQAFLSAGARNFVLNMPWQISCFSKTIEQSRQSAKNMGNYQQNSFHLNRLNLWAGPFCNVANAAYIEFLRLSGFSGAFITPELGEEDLLTLPAKSTLPLGIVIKGNWPLAISRIVSDEIVPDELFCSPRGESAWVTRKEKDFWIFPNWQLDLSQKQNILKQAGYQIFLTIEEPLPKGVAMKQRPGLWNLEIGLL